MGNRLSEEVSRFEAYFSKLEKKGFFVQRIADYAYSVGSEDADETGGLIGKKYPITLMGLVHGNEVAGIAVLNEILSCLELSSGSIKINGSLPITRLAVSTAWPKPSCSFWRT